jgi:hypothetical protein
MLLTDVDSKNAAVVLNSFCFDYALRFRTSGSHVTYSNILPMPVPPADVVNRLPIVETRLAWESGIEQIAEDEAYWPTLWVANKAVAAAYGLDAEDVRYILTTFPVFARKRRKFMVFLEEKVREWKDRQSI